MTALCYRFACKDKAFLLNYQIYVFFCCWVLRCGDEMHIAFAY